jgi:hypothetical protein
VLYIFDMSITRFSIFQIKSNCRFAKVRTLAAVFLTIAKPTCNGLGGSEKEGAMLCQHNVLFMLVLVAVALHEPQDFLPDGK